ncbi:Valencene synthase [Thalictrum thalictroides]|uniref:Valencene synthase n=1 Tax=Thalictrum thalictroides TaxID=46969 RepID=A0A7J6W716_THATH|nr:Valencene synthase [Thalictrum thalictroides]
MAALCSTFMSVRVFGNHLLPSSRPFINPRSVGNLPSPRSAITPGLKNVATRCSNANNVSSDASATQHFQFHPSVWDGYDFTAGCKSHLIDEWRLKDLKKEVKNMLSLAVVAADSFQALDLIDKIQRLGVAYHFKDEIEDILQRTNNDDYSHFFDQNIRKQEEHVDLCYVSLRFRLLRQAGYYVSTDVFKKFKDEKREFHANLASDVQGMLSLYEASYLSFRGEDIMDEAMNFSTKHLNSMLTCLSSSSLALQVQHALTMPLQRIPERVYARHYISVYEEDISHNETLLKFAKMDYNFVQLLHRKEINELQKWWKRIDLMSKLQCDFKNRVVEAYAITSNIYFEPQYSQGRIHLAKLWATFAYLDDAYDVFGSLDELELLCDAFQRWDANSTIELSDRMRVVFHEVLNFFNEIEKDMIEGGNVAGVPSFKELIQVQNKDLLKEVKVTLLEKIPTLEDWLSVSVPSAVGSLFYVLSYMNSKELATKEVFDWFATKPKVVIYSDLLTRLMADTASTKGYGPSMYPTLNSTGDVILVEKISPRLGKLVPGDIVTLKAPDNPTIFLTKRLLGLEGDQVTFLTDPHLETSSKTLVVPKGHVWVQGDNPYNSKDSRYFGPVPYGLLEGKLFYRIWPLIDFGSLNQGLWK